MRLRYPLLPRLMKKHPPSGKRIKPIASEGNAFAILIVIYQWIFILAVAAEGAIVLD